MNAKKFIALLRHSGTIGYIGLGVCGNVWPQGTFRKEEFYMSYEKLNDFIVMIDDMVWGVPLIVLIMAVGLLLTVCSKGIQFRCLGGPCGTEPVGLL